VGGVAAAEHGGGALRGAALSGEHAAATNEAAQAVSGLLSGILMAVPSTFGTVGLYFSLASLVPWVVFAVLVARRLWRLGEARGVA
jgi:hypothetical protein